MRTRERIDPRYEFPAYCDCASRSQPGQVGKLWPTNITLHGS